MRMFGKKMTCNVRDKSTTSHDDDVRSGLWTRPVKDNGRALWPEEEVRVQQAARAANYTQKQLRKLVAELHKKRQEAAEAILAEVA
jgi:hypothetical protein